MIGTDLESCIVRGNTSAYGGGGVFAAFNNGFGPVNPVIIRDCVITGNTAVVGGGVFLDHARYDIPMVVSGTTVGGNSADRGGAVYLDGICEANRSIFWGNSADSLGPVVLLADSSSVVTFTCSALDSIPVSGPGDAHYDGPQIFQDPKFCLPQPASNAPTTLGDYTLASSSPCLPLASPCDSLVGALGEGCQVVAVLPGPEEPPALKAFGIRAAPNPFDHSLDIHYLSPSGGDSRLEIYSVGGRLVSAWSLQSGSGVVKWDGRDSIGKPVASGIYLVRYLAGDLHAVHRVVRITRWR